jgi:hypothetical protein
MLLLTKGVPNVSTLFDHQARQDDEPLAQKIHPQFFDTDLCQRYNACAGGSENTTDVVDWCIRRRKLQFVLWNDPDA